MKLNIRMLTDNDWGTLVSWWEAWPEWPIPAKEFFPEEGRGGLIVEKEGKPIVAGFLYLTNSKGVLLEWIISDPQYKDNDRKEAIELLITGAENVSKELGYKYMFSIGRNKQLMETHKKLGWQVDKKPSHEIIKIIN